MSSFYYSNQLFSILELCNITKCYKYAVISLPFVTSFWPYFFPISLPSYLSSQILVYSRELNQERSKMKVMKNQKLEVHFPDYIASFPRILLFPPDYRFHSKRNSCISKEEQ